MAAPVSVREDQLTRLVALSPGDGRVAGLVRRVCAQTLSLPPLPAEVAVGEPESEAEAVVAEFAEQFSVDVSTISRRAAVRVVETVGGQHLWCCRADVHRRLHPAGAGRAGSARCRCAVSGVDATSRSPGITPPIRRMWCSTTSCPRWRDARARPGHLRAGPAARRGSAQLPAVQFAAGEHRTGCRRFGNAVRRRSSISRNRRCSTTALKQRFATPMG